MQGTHLRDKTRQKMGTHRDFKLSEETLKDPNRQTLDTSGISVNKNEFNNLIRVLYIKLKL